MADMAASTPAARFVFLHFMILKCNDMNCIDSMKSSLNMRTVKGRKRNPETPDNGMRRTM